ncbi:MAG: U32 family peptidase C-terminal domain-containing protein, partial [Deltaproteobacteria bacterium]|nr:U32 family peptidase C-terminal domain-containing protein [Deltaproteobacteria bacterium]
KIYAGEQLEVLSPGGSLLMTTMPKPLKTTDGRHVDLANNPQFILLEQDIKFKPYTILRRVNL